jgi:siroheme synthase-like protein
MPHFPLFIDLTGTLCAVIGGGAVAERRITALLDFGASLRVIAPAPSETIRGLAGKGRIVLFERPYGGAKDIAGARIVIAAANRKVNAAAAKDAAAAGIPVNAADSPDLCSFYFPALVRRGDMVAGISSSGGCPGLTARLRKELDALWPQSLGEDLWALTKKRRERKIL